MGKMVRNRPRYTSCGLRVDTMKVTTYEAVIKNGQVRLSDDAHIPEHTKVYVVAPIAETVERVSIISPRLAHPAQIARFTKEVTEEPDDARA